MAPEPPTPSPDEPPKRKLSVYELLGMEDPDAESSKASIAVESRVASKASIFSLDPLTGKRKVAKLSQSDEGILHVANCLSLREGVRLSFVSRPYRRCAMTRIAAEVSIKSADLVPLGPQRPQLLPQALRHLGRCWGAALQLLDLSGCDCITDDILQALMAQEWATLLELKLAGCIYLRDAGIRAAAEACRNLIDIDLSGCALITDFSIRYLVAGCPAIRQIHLSDCQNITDDALDFLGHTVPQLGLLDIGKSLTITDAGLAAMAFGCPRLYSLELEGCLWITNSGLQVVSECCTELTEISFNAMRTGGNWVTEWGMRLLIEVSRNLRHLRLRKIGTDTCLASASIRCIDLQQVDISDCPAVTDIGLEYLARSQMLLTFRAENCVGMSDSGMQALAAGCPYLRLLNLSGCTGLGDIGVGALTRCQLLEQVDLSRCHKLGDFGVSALAAGCPRLTGLVLSYCTAVGDDGVQAVAAGCLEIQELNLFKTAITDRSMLTVSEKCKHLTNLNIGSCFGISQAGMYKVRRCVPQMRMMQKRCNEDLAAKLIKEEEEAALAAALAAEEAEAAKILATITFEDCKSDGLLAKILLELVELEITQEEFQDCGVVKDNEGNEVDMATLDDLPEDKFPIQLRLADDEDEDGEEEDGSEVFEG